MDGDGDGRGGELLIARDIEDLDYGACKILEQRRGDSERWLGVSQGCSQVTGEDYEARANSAQATGAGDGARPRAITAIEPCVKERSVFGC